VRALACVFVCARMGACMSACVCLCVRVHVCVCASMHARVFVDARTCTSCASINMSVCVYVCVCVRVCVCKPTNLRALDQGHLALPVNLVCGFLWPGSGAVDHCADADHGSGEGGRVREVSLRGKSQSVIFRVGQNRVYTPYMTVYLVSSRPKIPYMHRIYSWFWQTLVIFSPVT
jgi:hypothetical protein